MRQEKTVKELKQFSFVIHEYLKIEKSLTKLSSCCKKQLKIFDEALNDHFDKMDNIQRKLCSVDSEKNIIIDQFSRYAFTKENSALLSAEKNKLLKEIISVEIIIDESFLDTLPDSFKYEFYEFLGIELNF